MSFRCKLGLHDWQDSCRCTKCPQTRDESHDWSADCERCSRCGQTRTGAHDWDRCRCTVCSKTRDTGHQWDGAVCSLCGRNKSAAQLWAEGSAQAGDWQGLADLAGRYTYQLSEEDQERQEFARLALLAAGERAVDAVGETLVQREDLNAWNLAWILLASESRRAVVPLVSRLADLTAHITDVDRVVEFIGTTHAVEAVPGLEALLDHEDWSARRTAAHTLGLLGVPASAEALLKAAEKYPSDVRGGLEEANTQFSRSVFASIEDKRKATGPNIEAMSEADMLKVLDRFLSAYLADDLATYRGLELTVRDIGVELDRRGGDAEMRRILEHFSDPSSARHLDRCWNGIGSWLG